MNTFERDRKVVGETGNRQTTLPGLRVCGLVFAFAFCTPAAADERAQGPSPTLTPELAAELYRADFAANVAEEKAQLRDHIAMLQVFSIWLAYLEEVAKKDPVEALNLRLPISVCRASILASRCDMFRNLFDPNRAPVDWARHLAPVDE